MKEDASTDKDLFFKAAKAEYERLLAAVEQNELFIEFTKAKKNYQHERKLKCSRDYARRHADVYARARDSIRETIKSGIADLRAEAGSQIP